MPGPAVQTPAVVVGSVRYGETSRIVRLATRDQGLVAAIAKGAGRPRSPFAGLQVLAAGTAHLIAGRGDLATLTQFELAVAHLGVTSSLTGFRAASTMAELAARAFPSTPQEEAYDALVWGLGLLDASPPAAIEIVALSAIWRLVAALGATPSLDFCARDGKPVPPGGAHFSIEDGGVLCRVCASGGGAARLEHDDVTALAFFLQGGGEPPDLDARHAAAHRRLVGRWITRHVVDGTQPALLQWVQGDDTVGGQR
ncbi:MAG TPA: DNA repair protein RecO [Gemmatimonadales bacterium]|nr:DNA repair protein RecO [Gemmatimonadales bacterium]